MLTAQALWEELRRIRRSKDRAGDCLEFSALEPAILRAMEKTIKDLQHGPQKGLANGR